MHLGPARRLERTNADGSEYHVEAELTQLEEGGSFVTDPYFTVRAGGEGSEDAVFTVDVSEIDILMGWFYQLAEKAQHLKPKP
ncbi:hypothetical protein BLSMQ_1959 [Brevibacterium aurantiacum]|uniref:Uncharacterized protein n=2 Tax=Brevibacterium aurantiacum TaxID=273384 RepID=A0A1D7W3R0_BREAU|nr:hypothetical protein BLSMQ_1959 [Brevibacterium aurantiacum]